MGADLPGAPIAESQSCRHRQLDTYLSWSILHRDNNFPAVGPDRFSGQRVRLCVTVEYPDDEALCHGRSIIPA